MTSVRIETRTDDRAARPRELAVLVRTALSVAAALVLVLLLDSLGLVSTIDEGLRARWVTLGERAGASRDTAELVVVVGGDPDTIAAWGPPPWPAERLAELLANIELGGPELIAELGYTRMFIASPELDALVESRRANVLIQGVDDDLESAWAAGGLDHGDLVLGPHSQLVELGIRSARIPPVPERLPVHWLTPRSRLPVVPAHQVANAKIPPRTFARRVVLLGITDPAYAMPSTTPVGPLSPVEIEAHALAGLVDGVVWAAIPRPWFYVGCTVLALLLLRLFERVSGAEATLVLLASIGLILALDFVCYERGWLRLGSGLALSTVAAISLIYWLGEAGQALAGLRQLRTRVLREAAGGLVDAREQEIDEAGFWDDLAALGSEYAQEVVGGAAASTVVEREDETWHLRVRSSAKLDPNSHRFVSAHDHLDMRRAPFRAAWLSLRASWTTALLPSGPTYGERKSLIVPLEDNGELLGLWLVHLHIEAEVEREDLEIFERLGRQMAAALSRRRERQALREQGGHARLRDHIGTIIGGLRLLRDEHRWALELLEQLPVRALIATVWGEIEFVDPRLQRDLGRRYPGLLSEDPSSAGPSAGPSPEHNLRAVLARLTGKSLDEAHRLMRKVVRSGVEIELDAVAGLEGTGEDVWVLSRIRSKRGIDLPGFKPAVHEHILLMARSSAPAHTIQTRSGNVLRVLGGSR